MRWFEKPDVVDRIIASYAGIEKGRRQFIWEEEGVVKIGNARAFTDYLSRVFGLGLSETSWSGVHEAMRALGEVAHTYEPRRNALGKRFRNQEPWERVIRRCGPGGEK